MARIPARVFLCGAALALVSATAGGAVDGAGQGQPPQAPAQQFGGSYSELGARRQKLIGDWVARFNELTGSKVDPQAFYDTRVRLSTKTTFDAVTNALIATSLTDGSGAKYGDALDLIERVDSVRGSILSAAGDHQFRMYARLSDRAIDQLERSREFNRAADNMVYHKGYPINYRQQGGTPSIQISIAEDRRRADIDVDYRSSRFPRSLFNGHLSAANSDVRAGDNYDRHTNRWSGFNSWWRTVFGGRSTSTVSKPEDKSTIVPATPRAGNKSIDLMVDDFLRAWLVDGDLTGALSYVSDRAYACLAQDADDLARFDRGMAPFQLLMQLKDARDTLGKRASLEGVVVGVRLARPALKVVTQPHHAQFVIYSVPDDVAAEFDCESRLTLAATTKPSRVYGRYYGATFYIDGQKDYSIALLWARQGGYWKIVSWQAEPATEDDPTVKYDVPAVTLPRATEKADPALVAAANSFLQSWIVRKDYDAAFKHLSPASYACYNLMRDPDAPAAASSADAARLLRAGFERAGTDIGKQTTLAGLLSAAPPSHPAVRLLLHPYSQTFALTSVPNALARAMDCAARARGEPFTGDFPIEYGQAYGMNLRFQTRSGETPVLRLLWMKEESVWRIAAYDVEYP
jgi:hypothetical protein